MADRWGLWLGQKTVLKGSRIFFPTVKEAYMCFRGLD